MATDRRFRLGFALVVALIIVLVIWWLIVHRRPASQPVSRIPVTAAAVSIQDVPLSVSALGSVLSWQGVTVHTQVNGVLTRVNFTEGAYVKKGQLLAEIDSAPYRAVLTQAQGALIRDTALLVEARIDLARYQTLWAKDSIAKQTLDAQAALVKQDEGVVLADKGTVDAARINVNYCRIVSPATGRVGVRLVDPGNVVSTSDTTGIVIVNQIQPIAVTFTIPQGDLQRLSAVSDAFTRPLSIQALSQETGALLDTGDVSIADNHIDQTTGTVELKARFPNASKQLWPGQFVNVKVTLQTVTQATTVPTGAVNQGPNGSFSFVIGPDDKVAVRPLQILATEGGTVIVKSGLKPGERVVTDGQMVLKAGVLVAPRSQPVSSGGSGKPAA